VEQAFDVVGCAAQVAQVLDEMAPAARRQP
jgi:hypothetical protein